ncbi:MAG: hypothetical protein A2V77_18825 [Anaeromyxobacter sp. RBG_16_69_14]|nr:MAG: hypothetical protein A2V77_18825 [Anaeromyxobacter sp. RBG_16_69_14]
MRFSRPALENMDLAVVKPVALPFAAKRQGPSGAAEDDDAVPVSRLHRCLRPVPGAAHPGTLAWSECRCLRPTCDTAVIVRSHPKNWA